MAEKKEMAVIEFTEHQQTVAKTVRDFVERDVIPVAMEMEHPSREPL
jgi:hypothetical protein